MRTLFIGLMSGTSMDGVDAALVDFTGTASQLVAVHSHPLDNRLREELQSLSRTGVNELERYAQLDAHMGRLFAEASCTLLQKAGIQAHQVSAIGSHGQTVRHNPAGAEPFSLQIGNPSIIAETTGITTVADFRRRDIAAGGQGAPLVPAFHNAVFRSPVHERVIVNIGGIANITSLPTDLEKPVEGFDTGPGNTLMDAWTHHHLHQRMDDGGCWAATGKPNALLLNSMLNDPYFALAPPKSTGPEYFNLAWLDDKLQETRQNELSAQDIQATLCELTASTIAQAIVTRAHKSKQILVCGGGVHNQTLLQRMRLLLGGRELASTLAYGIDPDWVEAMAFAWLAKQTLDGKPGNLPAVTGARRAVILGGIYRA
ncbi:MAG: anhydro-N-acetylmuramic acid kinase [Gammaproteobacteria bacterium]